MFHIFRDFIFFVFSLGLFINGLLFIPQIFKIIKEKEAKEFSKITFVGFCLTQLSAIIYGYLQNDKILMTGYSLALITCGTLTILIFYYDKK